MRTLLQVSLFLLLNSYTTRLYAQPTKCGTDLLVHDLKKKAVSTLITFKKNDDKIPYSELKKQASIITLPIVFHILLPDPTIVTDVQIYEQLKVLNNDWAGANADTNKVLTPFKPLIGSSRIRFCIARTDPKGIPTNGIERIVSNTLSTVQVNDPVKYAVQGGADQWDGDKYINVWIVAKIFPNGVLGYGSYPQLLPSNEDGIVIQYQTLPGGKSPNDLGRTLTHEMGHYFDLMHPWVPNGCDGSDFPGTENLDDTPPQATATDNCPTGIIPSGCSNGNVFGKLYQNYMDYPSDACLHMFTKGQISRAELSLFNSRISLTNATGCKDPIIDASGVRITYDPTNSMLYIQHTSLPIDLQGISIFNSAGALAHRQQFFRNANTYININVRSLAMGIYFLRLDYVKKTINQKFLKQ